MLLIKWSRFLKGLALTIVGACASPMRIWRATCNGDITPEANNGNIAPGAKDVYLNPIHIHSLAQL